MGARPDADVGFLHRLAGYLVGPIVGGIVAAVIYDRFVRKADSP